MQNAEQSSADKVCRNKTTLTSKKAMRKKNAEKLYTSAKKAHKNKAVQTSKEVMREVQAKLSSKKEKKAVENACKC